MRPPPTLVQLAMFLGALVASCRGPAPTPAPASAAAGRSILQGAHVIRGRLVDEAGTPVPEVTIDMFVMDREWNDPMELPELDTDASVQSFRATTGIDGRFRIDAPSLVSEWMTFTFEPPEYFSQPGDREPQKITDADDDIGDLVVSVRGRVKGRVTGSNDVPIRIFRVTVEDVDPISNCEGIRAGINSDFDLDRVSPGVRRLRVDAEGWLSDVQDVEVRARSTTKGVRFHLKRAPTISGFVVDEAGTPLGGVRVCGYPVGASHKIVSTTRTDGGFTIFLQQNAPYAIEVAGQEPYESWGTPRTAESTIDPGRFDVVIVVKRKIPSPR